jgi:hypothetical protein
MLVSLHGGERKSFTTRACTFVSSSNLENYSASILTNRCRHSIDVILARRHLSSNIHIEELLTQACGTRVIIFRVPDIEMLLRSLLGYAATASSE